MLALMILWFGLKIDSVKCVSAQNCVVHLNKVVSTDTKVYVKSARNAKAWPLTVKSGTQDVAFFLPASDTYISASLKETN